MPARRSPPPPPRHPDPAPAPRPAPHPVSHPTPAPAPHPAPHPVNHPSPAPAGHPAHSGGPAAHPSPGAGRRQGGRPTGGGHPSRHPKGGNDQEADRRQPGPDELAQDQSGGGGDSGGGGTDASVASADTGGDLVGTDTQQEIDVLRQEVGGLQFGRTWQAADPPKLAGKFGIALQGVEVGNNLRVAGRNFARKMATAAEDTGRTVTMVKNHKPPVYQEKK